MAVAAFAAGTAALGGVAGAEGVARAPFPPGLHTGRPAQGPEPRHGPGLPRQFGAWSIRVAQATSAGAASASAGGQEPRLAMEVDTTMIHLGDPVSVLLRVDHPAGWSVAWPDSLAVAPFEVLNYAVAPPSAAPEGDGVVSAAALALTSFELGELEIPAIEIPLAGPGGAVRSLFTDPFRIGVESVGIDESGEIREIRGPLAIARNWWLLAPWLLLAAAVGAGGFWLRGRLRERAVPEVAKPGSPPRPHRLVALEALDELERSSLLERGQVKRWHVRVSEIVRTYVEGQLEVPALEMTTPEVVAGLREAALGGRLADRFRTFLERCDLVKFAKLRPGAEASREVLSVARALVEMTSGPGREAPDDAGTTPDESGGRPGRVVEEPGATGAAPESAAAAAQATGAAR